MISKTKLQSAIDFHIETICELHREKEDLMDREIEAHQKIIDLLEKEEERDINSEYFEATLGDLSDIFYGPNYQRKYFLDI